MAGDRFGEPGRAGRTPAGHFPARPRRQPYAGTGSDADADTGSIQAVKPGGRIEIKSRKRKATFGNGGRFFVCSHGIGRFNIAHAHV